MFIFTGQINSILKSVYVYEFFYWMFISQMFIEKLPLSYMLTCLRQVFGRLCTALFSMCTTFIIDLKEKNNSHRLGI